MADTRRKAYMKAYRAKHKEREKEKRRARIAADPDKYRAQQRRYYYGVTEQETAALWVAQGAGCAICKADAPGGKGHWHLDHDHETGKVRGFLCQACNQGLGQFRDDPLRLTLAANYLRLHKNGRT